MEPSQNYWDVKASNVLTTENDSLMSWVFSDLVFEQLSLVTVDSVSCQIFFVFVKLNKI